MTENYLTPSIEDLREGYQCEVQEPKGFYPLVYSEEWTSKIIDGMGIFRDIRLLKSGHLRVPYLTKEQIEKEGWTNTGFKVNKDTYFFHYELLNGIVTIIQLGTVAFPDEVIFKGECKSINEFRYVCKLLNI